MAGKCKDEILITALVANPTIRAAAQACKVGETLVYTKLRDPEFKARYDAARLELMERNAAQLQARISGVIEEMAIIAHDPEIAPQIRLNACEAIIKNSLKLTDQVEILRRIEKLEEYQRNESQAAGGK